MTTLVLIHANTLQVQRIHDNTIGPRYQLDPNWKPDEMRFNIEHFRVNGPAKTHAEKQT